MMDPLIVVMFAMEFISLMLAVILVTAWNSFGRPRHALTWCAAFVVASIGWAANIVLVGARPSDILLAFGVDLLSMSTWSVMLLGFRQRARWPARGKRLIAFTAVSVATLALATLTAHQGLVGAIPPLFAAAMLAMSAGTMMFRAGSPAERAVITMLLAFAMLDVIGGANALMQGASGDAEQAALYGTLRMLTFPSAFTGTGLFVVFLLAADLAERMGRLASSDPLTGILNRRGFEAAAARAIANARRQGQPLTIVAADLDRFKSVNDRHGHACGDRVLCRFAEHVGGSIRAGDLLGRIGGEEFAMLLVDTPPSSAVEAINRIRIALGDLDIYFETGKIRVTASFGVTCPISDAEDLASMLARADAALYESKVAGRDRVTLAPLPPTMPMDLKALANAADAALALSGTAVR